jgi:hypothetical protein
MLISHLDKEIQEDRRSLERAAVEGAKQESRKGRGEKGKRKGEA